MWKKETRDYGEGEGERENSLEWTWDNGVRLCPEVVYWQVLINFHIISVNKLYRAHYFGFMKSQIWIILELSFLKSLTCITFKAKLWETWIDFNINEPGAWSRLTGDLRSWTHSTELIKGRQRKKKKRSGAKLGKS